MHGSAAEHTPFEQLVPEIMPGGSTPSVHDGVQSAGVLHSTQAPVALHTPLPPSRAHDVPIAASPTTQHPTWHVEAMHAAVDGGQSAAVVQLGADPHALPLDEDALDEDALDEEDALDDEDEDTLEALDDEEDALGDVEAEAPPIPLDDEEDALDPCWSRGASPDEDELDDEVDTSKGTELEELQATTAARTVTTKTTSFFMTRSLTRLARLASQLAVPRAQAPKMVSAAPGGPRSRRGSIAR